jgi:hypothetical protein
MAVAHERWSSAIAKSRTPADANAGMVDRATAERARSAAARMCAAARVLARHLDDAPSRRAVLLATIEDAEQELHRLFA